MKSHWLWLALGFGLLFSLLSVGATAHGQAPLTPDTLVLRFDESAAALNQPSIRAAIAQELSMSLATEGSGQAATLVVAVTAGDEVQLSYRPSREVLTRSVPVTNTSDVPRLLAHLAGNLVRNEASALIADLQPPPVAVVPPPAQARTVEMENVPVEGEPSQDQDTGDHATPYLRDAWIFSVLGGGWVALASNEGNYANLVFQLSKRFDRIEVGVGARFGYGNMRVVARPLCSSSCGTFEGAEAITGYQVTLPISAEYRVLGGDDAYLQLGGALGLRMSGIFNRSVSVTSGSDPYLFLGLQATAGFRLGDSHGVILRVGWDAFPPTQTVDESSGAFGLEPLPFGAQLGWQIGW